MRVLVWHWGRFGAGPRFAAELAAGFRRLPGTEAALSLSAQAELLRGAAPPVSALTVRTYSGWPSLIGRLATAPWLTSWLARELAALQPDAAVSAMPAPLDLLMATALARRNIPFGVVVHDAEAHPGDNVPFQLALQRRLVRRAAVVAALSRHVAERIRAQGLAPSQKLVLASHPPFDFGTIPPRAAHDGPLHLLFFGRLLRYKGLDLLAAALARLPPGLFAVRVVGRGPASPALTALAALPFVAVENRWVPEEEIGHLLGWADAVVLPYREASQSGVAAAALAAGRMVVATSVGGLAQQLEGEPLVLLSAPEPAAFAASLKHIAERPLIAASPSISADAAWAALAGRLRDALAAISRPSLAACEVAGQDMLP